MNTLSLSVPGCSEGFLHWDTTLRKVYHCTNELLFFLPVTGGKNVSTCFSRRITFHSFSALFTSVVCVFLTAVGDVGDVRRV